MLFIKQFLWMREHLYDLGEMAISEYKVSKSEAIESDDEIEIAYGIAAKWLYGLSAYYLFKSGL